MMHVLVTGCAGFIGSHLCEKLLAAGHLVTGVDSLTEYYDPAIKRRNLEACLRSPRFHFLQKSVDRLDAGVLRAAECIYHLAGRPGVRNSWSGEFPFYVADNILTTQHLLERVVGSPRLRRFVFASSSSVYGNTPCDQVSEQAVPNPFSPYGVTKLSAEHLCSLYAENFGVPTVSMRLFTVCGPRQRPDMLLSRLISAALDGGVFTLYGSGEVRRDFTAVADVVDALLLAADCTSSHRVFNISGGQPVAVSDVIRMVQEVTGSHIAVERAGSQYGDVRHTAADLTRARSELGYVPSWRIEDTVRAQVEFTNTLRAAELAAARSD